MFGLAEVRVESDLPVSELVPSALRLVPGRRHSVADVFRYASALQDAALAAGYPLVRVVVPPQDLVSANSVVRITVISGFIEAVDVTRLPARVRNLVARRMAPLVNRQPVRAAFMERSLLLAGSTAGLDMQATLAAGSKRGAAVLVLTGKYRAVQGAISVDNRLGDELGHEQITASAAFNNILGHAERLSAVVAAPVADPFWNKGRRRFLALAAQIPVGGNGLIFGAGYTYGSVAPGGASASLLLTNRNRIFNVAITYPVVLTRSRRDTLRLGMDMLSEVQATGITTPATDLSRDRTRVIRLGLSGVRPAPFNARIDYDVELSRGIDGFGARTADQATIITPLSRSGADARFTRIAALADLSVPLPGSVTARVTGRAMSGFDDPLLRSEQGSIIAADGVSGPASGGLASDSLLVGRAEMRAAVRPSWGVAEPYAFAATGTGWLEAPLVTEQRRTSATAYGAGVRIATDTATLGPATLSVELSRVRSTAALVAGSWFSFSMLRRF